MEIKNEIKKIIKGDIEDASEILAKYSRDAGFFVIKPKVVVFPKDVEDIKALVRFVSEKRKQGSEISLTPRSGGSDMTGAPLSEWVVLDFTRYFNKIKSVGSNSAVAEPGVYYRDFEKETLKKNLILPCFPASRELAALGGMVANNCGGEKTLAYGKINKYVSKLKMVLSDGNEYEFSALPHSALEAKVKLDNFEGELYRRLFKVLDSNKSLVAQAEPQVSKNSSGYYLWDIEKDDKFDLTQLFVGSQGTLGIITEITFELVQPKPYSRLLVIFMKDLVDLGRIVNTVLGFSPETFESYDDHTLKLALKFLPQFVVRLKSNIISLGFKFLPEFFMVLTGGLPKLVLTAEFSGDSPEEVRQKISQANAALAKFKVKTRITRNSAEADKYKTIRRESFNLLRKKVKNKSTAPFIDDIVVRPEYLSEFLPKLEKILNQYDADLVYTIAGHVGDGNFHIIPLMNLADLRARKIIPGLEKKVFDLVFSYHGSMSGEHNDGLVRGPFLRQMFGDKVFQLFKEVKNILDPLDIFNPGKKVDANLDYALAHIKKGE